jgi:hypothetical protein
VSIGVPGPIEAVQWPERLNGQIVDRRDGARIHGYDVEHDLARNYNLSELALLTLTGELPDETRARAFEIVLIHLAPVSIGEGPAHAAALTRLIGASTSAVLGSGSIALAEDTRFAIEAHKTVFAWLRAPATAFPPEHRAESDEQRARVGALRDQLSAIGFVSKILEPAIDPKPAAALLGVLFELGLEDIDRLQAAIFWARFLCAAIEGLAFKAGHFKSYPMDLPAFRHEEPGI